MKNRNCRFELRLSEDELSCLTERAEKAHLSNASFIRRAIKDKVVKEAPDVYVPVLIREVRRVGYNINQILATANARGLLDVPRLRKALDELHTVAQTIIQAYAVPEED